MTEKVIVEKSSPAVIALAVIAVVVSFAALALSAASFIRTFTAKSITTTEYPFDEDEESIGSDTLAF